MNGRKVLAVVIGFGIGVSINILFGAISTYMVDLLRGDSDTEAMAKGAAGIPMGAWLITLLGAILGSFLAGVVGAAISKEKILWITTAIQSDRSQR